jgi:Fe-S-cluster containining protein
VSSVSPLANAGALAALRALYQEVDEALDGWSCVESGDCCHFARTGREPYLWPLEWMLLERALAARGLKGRGLLPIVQEARACPLLGDRGRCTVYEARPFGCRTYFCRRASGPERRLPRERLAALGRRLAGLSEGDDPRGGGPRPLSRWLNSRDKKR